VIEAYKVLDGRTVVMPDGEISGGPNPTGHAILWSSHLALNADSRAKVDECAKLLDELGAEIDDEPAVVSEYGEDYYALWVRDPSGLRIEVVYQGA